MSNPIEPTTRDAEQQPLLPRPGEVSQIEDEPLLKNLVTGTAPLAQLGGIVLFGIVWGAVFTHKTLIFSAHPLLNAAAVLFAIQAILVVQPTHTPEQKRKGTWLHATFWAMALGSFYAALAIVLWHKQHSHIDHFESPHAILGLVIYGLLLLQAFVGVTQYFFPGIYGGVDNAKKLYRYHRVFGYILLLLILINVILASLTKYGGVILGIKTWATVLASVFVVIGIAPRIKPVKVALWHRSQ
ncbi:hypothetical protein EDC01DRAFT_651165 [Geopyxis carbonaria]|nr:hypothetical protein EDC01DRAFT_651165 [Geopyxis carbonaria]